MKKLTMLMILDGYGIAPASSSNAIHISGSKNINQLMKDYPCATLGASGLDVGLPDGQMGNSEVGHLNIGAGRIVYQELTRITKAIKDGDFFDNVAFNNAVDFAKKNGGKMHLMGLLSDGGVHSHLTHLFALIKLCKEKGLNDVFVHCFLDGRDVSPTSGAGFIKDLYGYMQEINFGHIATVSGRYYAMDRDNRWERVEKAYVATNKGIGEEVDCPYKAVLDSYENGITDEFVVPKVVVKDGKPVACVENGDSVIFFNFRPDRARELTRAYTQDDFNGFEREKLDLYYVCMTQYDATFKNVDIAFRPQSLKNTLGEYVSSLGKTQLRIAETEKYAHVTFFFNGGVEKPNENEDRILVPSPKVATYDLQPEMSAPIVCEKVIEQIRAQKYDLIILNFANCDMVGHTGIMEAAVKAVSVVDECAGKIADEVRKIGGSLLITADHGNADKMAEDGKPFTAHTTNLVPLILVDDNKKDVKLNDGRLCDLAPTLLTLMELPIPSEMSGKSLF
ncbi:MAG: 2,3-bisphosphoglycerate-independent phosphoglycerate mutase [Clostridia bacterium]|nr:2,3-bisphosphoglycerate-independent phosphoglycerate mutase [Clostridia bacterium]